MSPVDRRKMDTLSSAILYVSAVICVMGLTGNIFCAVILKNMEKKKIGGVRLIRYLACADISVLVFYIVSRIVKSVDVYVYPLPGSVYIDFVILHMKRISYTFEVYLTMLISLQRCLALSLPFQMTVYMTNQRINKILIGTAVLSIVLPLPACAMIYPRLHLTSQNISTEDTQSSHQQSTEAEWIYRHYILATFYIYIPLVVLVACNITLIVFRFRMTTDVRNSNTSGPGQLTAVVFTMTTMSVATHIFNLIYLHLCSTGVDPVSDSSACLPKLLTNLFLYVNCSANVIFYCCFGRSFRKHFSRLFCKKTGSGGTSSKKSERETRTTESTVEPSQERRRSVTKVM